MKIEHNIKKIGSRVRLTEDLEMFNCTYTKGHEFTIYGQTQRGFDLVDADGNKVTETLMVNDILELIK